MSSRKLRGEQHNNSSSRSGSGSSERRCKLCDCFVPGNEHSWQTHVTGIRHRRNVASQKVFGEAAHAVVSVFEHIDATPQTYRSRRDAVLAAAQQATAGATGPTRRAHSEAAMAHKHQQGAAVVDPLQGQLHQLQRQLRKHLATQVGVSCTYSRAVERFSFNAMAAAAEQLTARMDAQLQQQPQQLQHEVQAGQEQPGQTVQLQQSVQGQGQEQAQRQSVDQQQQQQKQGLKLNLDLQDAAQIACLAVLLPAGVSTLHLTVPYQSYGPGAAASSAAMACFLSSLAHHHALQQLEVHFQCAAYNSILQQGRNSLARLPELWGKSLAALTAAMQVNCGLLRLVVAAYPGQFPVDNVVQLQTCLATSRPTLRLAVLLGTHPRVGAASHLAGLPHEVLRSLLDRAVPRQACSLHLDLPQGLAVDNSSNSSSSSSSSSEDDSSSGDIDSDAPDG